ncbi:hypothetical protein PENSPDRAFT_730873 [Peniophora sp. CONT]|nr:hypothetical protein PENSPDRAFT_730873 [Peniophora sp. CONT]
MSSDTVPPLDVVKSTHVWMSDGTIVLHATSSKTKTAVLFRVHKSVLALNCAAFQALFGDDTTVLDQSSEQYEGVPVMHTYEDANDMEDFLRALYYPEYMQRHNEPMKHKLSMNSFPKLYMGAMRLARKFDAPRLYSEFQHILLRLFPKTLSDAQRTFTMYYDREVEQFNWAQAHKQWCDEWELIEQNWPDPAYAIRIAVDLSLPDVLPTAFYVLMKAYQDMYTDPDGNQDFDTVSHIKCYGDLNALTKDDLKVLLVGSAAVRNWLSNHWIFPMDATSGKLEHCDPPSARHRCYERFCPLWDDMVIRTRSREAQVDPLRFLSKEHDEILSKAKLCENCRGQASKLFDPLRERLWKRLPTLFNLTKYGVDENWGEPNAW